MPYQIKKVNNGFKVCKKDNPHKCFSKKPLTKENAKKQLKAIGLNEHMKKKGKGKNEDNNDNKENNENKDNNENKINFLPKKFSGKLIFFGMGGVAKCCMHLLEYFLKPNPKKIFMFDLIDYSNHPDVKKYIDKGAHFQVTDLNKHYKEIIDNLSPFDIVIDLTCMTDSNAFMLKCKECNVHYINTSLEDKESLAELKKKKEKFDITYQKSHNEANEIKKKYPSNKATMLIINGANPGLISTFIKIGLLFLASKLSKKESTIEIKNALKERDYGKLCKYLKVSTIHCSETDSSDYVDKLEQNLKVFTNTWCINGFVSEGSQNSEFTYGSNEKTMPKDSKLLHDHIIELNKPALDVFCESYVPYDGIIVGVVIPHSEGISSSIYFSDDNFCCTQHYVYKICQTAWRSLNKFYPPSKYGHEVKESHVLNNLDDKFYGIDRLGALILTENNKSVWCGSCLDNKDKYIGNHSGTLQQVACSVLTGLKYMIENKNEGILFPEDLDENYVIKHCLPFLGEFFCDFVPYHPKSLQFDNLVKSKKEFDEQY